MFQSQCIGATCPVPTATVVNGAEVGPSSSVNTSGAIAGGVIGGFFVLLAIVVIIICWCRHTSKADDDHNDDTVKSAQMTSVLSSHDGQAAASDPHEPHADADPINPVQELPQQVDNPSNDANKDAAAPDAETFHYDEN